MLKNYIKISWRSLIRNKAYAAINIAGMALGMACGILIFTVVTFNLGFDNFHANTNRIYRCVTEAHRDGVSYFASVPPAFGSGFRRDFAATEAVARIVNLGDETITVKTGNDVLAFKEAGGVNFAEASYFDIFNFPLLAGDKKTALLQPYTAIITQDIAQKYFANTNPVGQTFSLNLGQHITVTGVLQNLPANTDAKGEIFISYQTLKTENAFFTDDNAWGFVSSRLQCYAKLKPGTNAAAVEKLLPAYLNQHNPQNKNLFYCKLQPLADVHFDARYGGAMEKRTLWILSFIGIFIIITACVNFINLATAQALKRSKEVGVRKVLGSMRSQLFWQFITETGIIAITGVAGALLPSYLLLPYVNTLFNVQMALFAGSGLLWFLLALAVIITLLAGAYPGIILANFKPVAALKGKISQQHIGGFNTRRGLIIMQFAISQVLITGIIIIAMQMRYTGGSSLGFNKDAIVMVPIGLATSRDAVKANRKAFKDELAAIPGVQAVSVCSAAPAAKRDWSTAFKYNNRATDEPFSLTMKPADNNYIPTFGLEMVAGRNIPPSDTLREFVVNETFVRKLGLQSPQDVIGKKLSADGMAAPIVGVVKDFHDKSFHSDINALCIFSDFSDYQNFAIKINMANASQTLQAVKTAWNKVYPSQVYEYSFLDDEIASFYKTEETMLTLVQAFTIVAIFIGCLGLYGLVSFMAVQKTKEIGIRKVLGSTVAQILWIFGQEFSRLIIVAFAIATPVAWWLMHSWLQGFKFRISISPLFFAGSLLLMFFIAFATVGYQATKAALMNPVNAIMMD